MNDYKEAQQYIEELKKKGFKLYKIANTSPEELMESMVIDIELAEQIITLAKEEVYEKMDTKSKKNPKKNSVIKLPHIGNKRAKLLEEKNIDIKKIAAMTPKELREIVPNLKWKEAEDIIIAAELYMERELADKKVFDTELLKIPYVSASRAYLLHSKGISVEKLASMRPEELLKILKDIKREQAEKIIIFAENYVEGTGTLKHESESIFVRRTQPLPHRINKKHAKKIKINVPLKPETLVAGKSITNLRVAKKHAKKIKIKKPSKPKPLVASRSIIKLPKPVIGQMKRGLVNGNSLVNGRGVVNGFGPRRKLSKSNKSRILPAVALGMLIILAAILPIVFLAPVNPIKIDGNFSDWAKIKGVNDPFGSSDGPLLTVKSVCTGDMLYLYVHASTSLFSTPEGLFIFIDKDKNASTGYRVSNIGADYMIAIKGWDNRVQSGELYKYVSAVQNNWSAFSPEQSVKYALRGGSIELGTSLKLQNPTILAYLKTNHVEDSSDIPLIPNSASALVIVNNTENKVSKYIEKITVYPSGSAHITLHLMPFGDYTNLTYTTELYENVSGNMERIGTNYINTTVSEEKTFYLALHAQGNGTIGFKAVSNEENIRVLNTVASVRIGNIVSKIDGNFDEWKNITGISDPLYDVSTHSNYTHENIDLVEVKRLHTHFYIKTAAPILAGDCIPEVITKPIIDSDRDTVPDKYDLYPHDFNNDGIPDNESYVIVNGERLPDVDGDGIADYPYGPDMWLNTTIPSNFPKPYAGRHVSVYIGPLPYVKITGNDTFFVYISSRNGTYHAPFLPFSSNYMVKITGRGFQSNAFLFKYNGSAWKKVKKVPVAFAGTQLEGDSYISGKIFVLSRDWLGQYDIEEFSNDGNVTIIKINQNDVSIEASADDAKYVNTTLYWNGTMSFGNLTLINCTVVINGTLDLEIAGDFYMDKDSVITANGTGYAGGVGGTSSTRNGEPGGGPGSGGGGQYNGGGGGGGGYGNAGGAGGGNNGGAGGTPYGTDTGTDIDMGSGGGGGAYTKINTIFGPITGDGGAGGAGGGYIKIDAGGNIKVDGAIYANGKKGSSGGGAGGGGGSGGGILLNATNITINGYLNATGGAGGDGGLGSGGGGGSGGRIKLVYTNSYYINSTGVHYNVSGGSAGSSLLGSAGNVGNTGAFNHVHIPELNTKWDIIITIGIFLLAKRKKYRKRVKRRT